MKKAKKIIAIMLAFVMLLAFIPTMSFAAKSSMTYSGSCKAGNNFSTTGKISKPSTSYTWQHVKAKSTSCVYTPSMSSPSGNYYKSKALNYANGATISPTEITLGLSPYYVPEQKYTILQANLTSVSGVRGVHKQRCL